jgi:uncharacterized protein involved in response to NO
MTTRAYEIHSIKELIFLRALVYLKQRLTVSMQNVKNFVVLFSLIIFFGITNIFSFGIIREIRIVFSAEFL